MRYSRWTMLFKMFSIGKKVQRIRRIMRNERSDRSVVKHGEDDVDTDVQHANKVFRNVSRSTLARNAPNTPK